MAATTLVTQPLAASPAVGELPDPTTIHLPSIGDPPRAPISQEPQPVTIGEGLPPIPGKPPVVGVLPDPRTIHLPPIVDPPRVSIPQEPQPVTIGEGLPPIPGKLAKKIGSGQFVELSELLPDSLSAANALGEVDSKASKPATKPNLSIIEWVQSFGIYTAILSKSQPHRVADLLGYQTLILQAYQEFRSDFWLRYDRTFRQKASTSKNAKWAAIDTTIWSLAFSGRGRSGSLEHDWDRNSSAYSNPVPRSPRQPLVCFKWNWDNCTFRNCKFPHKCSYCVQDPRATDTSHKAMSCPYRKHTPGSSHNQ